MLRALIALDEDGSEEDSYDFPHFDTEDVDDEVPEPITMITFDGPLEQALDFVNHQLIFYKSEDTPLGVIGLEFRSPPEFDTSILPENYVFVKTMSKGYKLEVHPIHLAKPPVFRLMEGSHYELTINGIVLLFTTPMLCWHDPLHTGDPIAWSKGPSLKIGTIHIEKIWGL